MTLNSTLFVKERNRITLCRHNSASTCKFSYVNVQHARMRLINVKITKLHINTIISNFDMIMLHVSISMLHVARHKQAC